MFIVTKLIHIKFGYEEQIIRSLQEYYPNSGTYGFINLEFSRMKRTEHGNEYMIRILWKHNKIIMSGFLKNRKLQRCHGNNNSKAIFSHQNPMLRMLNIYTRRAFCKFAVRLFFIPLSYRNNSVSKK